MKDWQVALLVVLGVGIGIVVTIILTRSTASTEYKATYSNVEKWEIVKDERGRVTGVYVTRNAKENR